MTRISLVWLLLVAATLLSFAMEWLLGSGNGDGGDGSSYSALAILLLAFIKVRFVILDFMELRNAPLALRLINELWVLALAAVLMLSFSAL